MPLSPNEEQDAAANDYSQLPASFLIDDKQKDSKLGKKRDSLLIRPSRQEEEKMAGTLQDDQQEQASVENIVIQRPVVGILRSSSNQEAEGVLTLSSQEPPIGLTSAANL